MKEEKINVTLIDVNRLFYAGEDMGSLKYVKIESIRSDRGNLQ